MSNPECWNCDNHHSFQVDGYNWGDRVLEGVMFTVTFDSGIATVSLPDWKKNKYLKRLNIPKFCQEIQDDFINRPGYFNDMLKCSSCDNWLAQDNELGVGLGRPEAQHEQKIYD